MSATVPVRPELVEGRSLCEHLSLIAAAPSGIKKLRELILELAVRGKLVPQDPNDEPASELLKRIETENALLVREKIKKKRPLAEIRQDEKLFDIPSGWKWVRFYNVTLSRLGKMLDKTKNRGELKPYLRNTNVQWCHFDLDDVKLMRIEDSERKNSQFVLAIF